MGRAMFNKSLIQFSVDEWCYIPSLLFDLRPNYGGGHEDNGDNGDLLQKVPCLHCCSPTPLPETPGHLLASLGWSVLGSLGPGVHKVLFVPSKSLFLQSCVSSVGSVVGLMATSSRGLIPYPGRLHPEPDPCDSPLLTGTSTGDAKHSSVSVSVGYSKHYMTYMCYILKYI